MQARRRPDVKSMTRRSGPGSGRARAHGLGQWLAVGDDDDPYPSPSDRRARLEAFADAYGLSETAGLVDRVISGQCDRIEQVRRLPPPGGSHRRAG